MAMCSSGPSGPGIARKVTVRVEIHGSALPGRRCPRPDGGFYENIHVGIQKRKDAVDLQPGDAEAVRWTFDITAQERQDGVDVTGPFVHGRPGDRFLYLSWGTVEEQGHFVMFRRAKLLLSPLDPRLIRAAAADGARLIGRLELTARDGYPRCASVKPTEMKWSVEV